MDKVFHVISNTHWDREWRYSFQRNRKMLVDMIDKVLEILETEPEYKAFHLDSQSVVLKDYLEIKPQNKKRIKDLVRAKRLLIGPWYILPDEFQVGGENLIRNLLLGHKTCEEFGGASKIGYSPFSWGQISQLPQLYTQFGIDVVMFYRGVNSIDSPKAEFIWEGADKTRVLTSRFSTMPRYNFYFYIYRPVVHDEDIADIEYKWEKGGSPFHIASTDVKEDYYCINPSDRYYKNNIKDSVNAIIRNQAKDFTTPNVIWMEGHDSSGPNKKTVQIIKDIKELMPEVNVIHSDLEEYTKALKESADIEKLALVTGERRSAQFDNRSGNMFAYTLSARMDIKIKNFEAEKILQYYAEPLNSICGMLGMDLNDRYLSLAWENLIQNSAHDSIGGCSIDAVHNDMFARYNQVMGIGESVIDRALKYLANQINLGIFAGTESNNKSIFLTFVNTLQNSVSCVKEVFIDIPRDFPQGSFEIVDSNNNQVPFHILDSDSEEPVLEQMIDRPMYFAMHRFRTLVYVKEIPSLGYKTLKVIPKNKIFFEEEKLDIRDFSMENEFIKIDFNPNGTMNLLSKETNSLFYNTGYFEYQAEGGYAWTHVPIGEKLTTLNSSAYIYISEKNELRSRAIITNKLVVPAGLDENNKALKETKEIKITLEVILNMESKYPEFIINVNNQAECHRLRMIFPILNSPKHSYAAGQFDVVKRKTIRPDTPEWVEQPMYDYPMHHFVDIEDNNDSFSILSNGLTEYEVTDDEQKLLCITLYRAFKYVIYPSSREDYSNMKGSQMLGAHKFKLAFYPHSGNYIRGGVYEQAFSFLYPPMVFQSGLLKGRYPSEFSFLEIDNKGFVLSCIKKAEDEKGFVIRFYNSLYQKSSAKVRLNIDINNASIVTLEEKEVKKINHIENNEFEIEAGSRQIVSIKIS